MFKLAASDPVMGLAAPTVISNTLDKMFGTEWLGWEPETISIELKVGMDELLIDKIYVLQIMRTLPQVALEDSSFFLHAVSVMNNSIADFDSYNMPTSLELAFAIDQYKKILGEMFQMTTMIKEVTAYILSEEGYSKPPVELSFIDTSRLIEGQSKEDTLNKHRAVSEYIEGMNSI